MTSNRSRLRPLLRDEAGNMGLALLAMIAIGGVVAALFSVTISTQESVREDRNFQMAINGGDAGVQLALTQISELTNAATTTLSGTAVVGDVEVDWEANRNGNAWEIVSTGTDNATSRTVEALIEREATFRVGAFADVALTMRGANGAVSYDSSTGDIDTGLGSVGSNGTIAMNGNAFADQILLYGSAASCTGNGCSTGDIEGSDTRFDIDAVTGDIASEMGALCSAYVPFVASASPPLVAGETYCFSSMLIDQDEVIQSSSDGTPPSLENAVTIFLSGNFDMSNHVALNCGVCTGANATPDAGALQIYGTGTQLRLGNNTKIAAAIAMPNASCQGSPSNAQAEVYGAMICNDLSNQGGWDFHYDQNLLMAGNGWWDITEWREELAGQSSF